MQRLRVRTIALASACACAAAALLAAQAANPRIGKWKLKQDPPALNIMTYEPWGNGGMKVTVESTNRDGRKATWTYNTMFDNKDMPVSGDTRTETSAVRKIDDRTTEIVNKKAGRVLQIITNVISEDGNIINNTYRNFDAEGKPTRTTTAVYERIH